MGTNQNKHTSVSPKGGKAECTESAAPFEPGESSAPFTFLMQEIISYLGTDFVKGVPLELLEAYCMRTIDRDEPTGKILYGLLINFMIAYSNPETSDEAMKAFDFLDYLANPA